jgi:hypothetical protein
MRTAIPSRGAVAVGALLATIAAVGHAAGDHAHHHHAPTHADAPKTAHDICWSGDSRWCDASAEAAHRGLVLANSGVADSMLPDCARGPAVGVFADGYETVGTGVAGVAAAWSDPATWGGTLPQAGQSVSIPAGRRVVLDIATPALATLTIEGELIAAHDRDLVLSADIVMVHGGLLRIGCADDPYTRTATLTLTGSPSNASPHEMGTKVLGAMATGRIEIFGRPVRSWTRLAANAAAGATQVDVVDATGWRVGDRMVVASGSTEPNQAELRTVVAITGTRLTLDAALATPRVGALRTVDGRVLDLRTEVGLLSRNITIQGDAGSDATRFGGHMMTMAGSTVRVDGVRFVRMGQFDRLGRYPFHWHLVGDASGQFIRNSAVEGSFQRGIVIHATRNVEVANNVVFDTVGHNYVVEDPAATQNTLRGNLGVKTRIAFMTDPGLVPQNDDQASNFWIRAARNTFTDNVAAGAEGNGFWFDHTADSPTDFRGNAAHSSAGRADHVVFNRQSGLLVENSIETAAAPPLVFDGNLFHHNRNGLWPTNEADAAAQTHRNTVFADHPDGFPLVSEAVGSLLVFEDPLFVGDSAGGVPTGARLPPIHLQYGAAVNLLRPVFAHWGDNSLLSANDIFADWQADFAISGARFVATVPTAATFHDGTVLHAVDDSYLPRGMYVDARWPALAGPGAQAVTIGETPALRAPALMGHAFIKLRVGATETPSNGTLLARSDGLRFTETGSVGWRMAYGGGLSYRFETRPSTAPEFALRLDLVGGMARPGLGAPRSVLVLPAAQAPQGLFRPGSDADGDELPPSPANALQAAGSLAAFEGDPLNRYWYDPASATVRFTATEGWVVVRP